MSAGYVFTLITFVFNTFIDYTAWQFDRERQQVEPYLELIKVLESTASAIAEQIKNACSGIEGLVIDDSMQSQVDAQRLLDGAVGQLKSIDKHLTSLHDEARPLIASLRKRFNQ